MNKVLGVIVMATLSINHGTGTMVFPSYASGPPQSSIAQQREAPVAISGSNVYVAWSTNESTIN
jgi:hypothetical protein